MLHAFRNIFLRGLLLISLGLLCSCEDSAGEDDLLQAWDCNEISAALIAFDHVRLEGELGKVLPDLLPKNSDEDPTGHEENFRMFIKHLEECGNLQAELLCYACIKTYPAQSEIEIVLDSADQQVSRILDILTPEDASLAFIHMHNAH